MIKVFIDKYKIRSTCKTNYLFQYGGENGNNQINEEALINKEISFIDDISLSILIEFSQSNGILPKKYKYISN